MKNTIIKEVEKNQITTKSFCFRSGDSVIVKTWVVEGKKKRLQIFDGIVIAIRKRGLGSSFTVRRYSYGEGVERVFHLHSPMIESVVVKRYGKVHQSKLYYLRRCSGKNAKVKEKI